MPEGEQETGRSGAKRFQRLLEGTMRFKLPYDAYEHGERVTLPMLGGGVKRFDLAGDYRDENAAGMSRIYVECKARRSAGNQKSEFEAFLAHAYSATQKGQTDLTTDPKYEFMWATACPWKGDGFPDVASEDEIRKAVEAYRDGAILPEDHEIDEAVLREVAGRIWVWVVSDRQEDMMISAEMRGWVAQHLEAAT